MPSLQGCHTQATSMDELLQRMREAILLCLEMRDEENVELLELVGIQKVTV